MLKLTVVCWGQGLLLLLPLLLSLSAGVGPALLLLLSLSAGVGPALLLLLAVVTVLLLLLVVVAAERLAASAVCACISSCSVSCRICMCSLVILYSYIWSCCSMALQSQDMCRSGNV
jgi:hypothetical protein